jgi:hypothetical protein
VRPNLLHSLVLDSRYSVRSPRLPNLFALLIKALSWCLFEFANHENEVSRSNWLLTKLRSFYNSGTKTFKFQVFGRLVCAAGWMALYGVKKTRFYEIRQKVISGEVVIVHGNALREYPTPKWDLMRSWLNMSIDRYCEWIPHLQLVVLPYGVDKVDWYHLCCSSLREKWKVEEDEIPALTYFYQILKQRYPFLKTSRRITLGRCFICIYRKLKLKDPELSKEERQKIIGEGDIHLDQVMRERDKYKAVTLASRNPENQLLSLILDKGNGPRIPHLAQYPKNWATLSRPKTSLFAFIRHGKAVKCIVPFLANYPDDPNFVASIFVHELVDIASEGDLPLDAHVQFDNCGKENKNQ